MRRILKPLLFLLCLAPIQPASAQTDKEKALAKAQEGVKLMDEGKHDESIKLLEEAQKLDPERIDFPYELAYAHYLKKDYKGAIKILEKITGHKDVNARVFQLLGNTYDVDGQSDKALAAYDAGLKKFPNSGLIYVEKGNVYWGKKEYGKALPFYEAGIKADPSFPSNYYRAARIYLSSTEEVWGMIYGEIFMNLERNSPRTAEISKLLYDTYKSEISYTNDTSVSVSFCKEMVMDVNSISDPKKFKLPFSMIYEQTLAIASAFEKKIDLKSLNNIRTSFVSNYYESGHHVNYKNVLFDFQKKIKDAGHLEAYNHWILMKGDTDGFNAWAAANKTKWDNFARWFNANGLLIDDSNKFYYGLY